MPIPPFLDSGELPPGIYSAKLTEMIARFGGETPQRQRLADRLERIFLLAKTTGHLRRFVVFGSFVTDKAEPNDVDVFMVMEDSFQAGQLTGDLRLLFDHQAADAHFGASVFWVRKLAAMGGEEATIEYWQTTRAGNLRGIVEIVEEAP